MMNAIRVTCAVLISALLVASVGEAGTFDGSKSLLCAPATAVSCTSEGKCETSGPEGINFPLFLRMNAGEMQVRGTLADGTEKTVVIARSEKREGALVLQGDQEGRAWSLEIDGASGKMTLAVAGRGEGFLVFGACTNP